jgi:membrane-associated protein
MHWVYQTVQQMLGRYGYWAVLGGLLGENAGLPLPGETILMFAAFVAHKNAGLRIQWVVLIGITAAVMGDNLGFLAGRKLGERLIGWLKKLLRMDDTEIAAAKDQIRRHGGATVFWARYVFGLRMIAGPLAGVLGMDWRKFVLYNALGGATWVTTISVTGFAFASEFNPLLGYVEKSSWAIAAGLFIVAYIVWRRQKARFGKRRRGQRAAD